ncbi:hypothetical protein [Streptomyces filipinensis]|nr:hypothetical protein [Streptomyces filipinensis]
MRLFGITEATALRHVVATYPERTAKLPRWRRSPVRDGLPRSGPGQAVTVIGQSDGDARR